MDITNYTDEQKKTFQNSLDTGVSPQTASQSISSATLSGNATPVSIPTPTPSTETAGINGGADAKITSAYNTAKSEYDVALKDYQDTAQNKATQGKNNVFSYIQEKVGILGSKPTLETEAKVPELKKLANDAYSELQKSKQSQLEEVKALESANMTSEGKAVAQRDITNKYAITNAGLSVSYDIANRNYLSAEQGVEDKIKALSAPADLYIDYYSKFLANNESNLNESEKAKIEFLKSNKEDERKKIEEEQKAIFEIQKEAAKNGASFATLNSIGSTTTRADALRKAGGYMQAQTPTVDTPLDPNSNSILSQTGLSLLAFNYLTQGTPSLSRLPAGQRNAVMNEAQKYLNSKGVDVSTFQSQYKAYNDVLQKNLARANQTQIMAGEVAGSADALSSVIDEKDFGRFKAANVLNLMLGNEVNDKTTIKYRFQLQAMANDLAGYFAASRGATSPELQDQRDAAEVITNGLNKGSVEAFKSSVLANEEKVTQVVNKAAERSKDQVWTLFGVKRPTAEGANTSVKINGQDVPVGAIIENSAGKRAKVNADGTITPL